MLATHQERNLRRAHKQTFHFRPITEVRLEAVTRLSQTCGSSSDTEAEVSAATSKAKR
jgi:hypothetical protein